MESGKPDPVAWLRAQVEAEKGAAELGIQARAEGPHHVIADCEAKLAIIGRCEGLLPPDESDLDENYHDGRDDWERWRDLHDEPRAQGKTGHQVRR